VHAVEFSRIGCFRESIFRPISGATFPKSPSQKPLETKVFSYFSRWRTFNLRREIPALQGPVFRGDWLHLSRISKQNSKLWTTCLDYAVVGHIVKSKALFFRVFSKYFLANKHGCQRLLTSAQDSTVPGQDIVKNGLLIGDFLVVHVDPTFLDGPSRRGNAGL
jgi:hypothetical protein